MLTELWLFIITLWELYFQSSVNLCGVCYVDSIFWIITPPLQVNSSIAEACFIQVSCLVYSTLKMILRNTLLTFSRIHVIMSYKKKLWEPPFLQTLRILLHAVFGALPDWTVHYMCISDNTFMHITLYSERLRKRTPVGSTHTPYRAL
jgi:hypothetical protein